MFLKNADVVTGRQGPPGDYNPRVGKTDTRVEALAAGASGRWPTAEESNAKTETGRHAPSPDFGASNISAAAVGLWEWPSAASNPRKGITIEGWRVPRRRHSPVIRETKWEGKGHNRMGPGRKSELAAGPRTASREEAMPENRTTTIAWSTGHITVSDPAVAEAFIEALTQKRLDAVITLVWDDQTEERALIHDVSPEDLAWERLAIEGVGDFSTLICEVMKMEQAPAEDMHCPGCNQRRWWIAIIEEAEDENFTRYVRRLRTCRVCGHQMTTREMRSIGINNSDAG